MLRLHCGSRQPVWLGSRSGFSPVEIQQHRCFGPDGPVGRVLSFVKRDKYCLRTSVWMPLFPVPCPLPCARTQQGTQCPQAVGPARGLSQGLAPCWAWHLLGPAVRCPRVLQGLPPTKRCQKEQAPGSEAFILQGWRRGATRLLRSIGSLAECRKEKKRQSWNKHFMLIIVFFFVVFPVPSWIR